MLIKMNRDIKNLTKKLKQLKKTVFLETLYFYLRNIDYRIRYKKGLKPKLHRIVPKK